MPVFLNNAEAYAHTYRVWYHVFGGVAKLVIAPACQAGDRGFDPRHSRLVCISFLPVIEQFNHILGSSQWYRYYVCCGAMPSVRTGRSSKLPMGTR